MSELDGPDGSDEPGDDDGGQQSHDAGKGPEPADNPGGYPGASVAARIEAEDRLPLRGEAHAATWSSPPRIGHGSGQGDQGQPAVGEAPSAAVRPGDRPSATPGPGAEAGAAEREVANAEPRESSPAGPAADAGNTAEANAAERPGEAPQASKADAPAGQAMRPDDDPANPDAAPDAGLKELMTKYEARLERYEAKLERQAADNEARVKDLEAELQALKDGRQAAPDTPENTESQLDQPRWRDHELSPDKKDPKEVKPEGDKPGLWSNAKYQLYGALGSAFTSAYISEVVLDSPVNALIAIVSALPSVIGAFVPVVREGWRSRKT